jgi:hypothetical protein
MESWLEGLCSYPNRFAFGIGIVAGMIIGANEGSADDAKGLIVIDIIAIIILIYMCGVKRKITPEVEETHVEPESEETKIE